MEVLNEVDETDDAPFSQIFLTQYWNAIESAAPQALSLQNLSEPWISGLSQMHSRLPLLTKQAREALKKEKPSFKHGT